MWSEKYRVLEETKVLNTREGEKEKKSFLFVLDVMILLEKQWNDNKIMLWSWHLQDDRNGITSERFQRIKESGKKFTATTTATISAYVNKLLKRDFNEEKKVEIKNKLEESLRMTEWTSKQN